MKRRRDVMAKNNSVILALCCLFGTSFVCESALQEEIQAVNDKFVSLYNSGDPDGVSKLYTADCRFLAPDMEIYNGQFEASLYFYGTIRKGMVKLKLEIQEVGPLNDETTEAFERSLYTFYDKDNEVADYGKYLVIWKKIDSDWKLFIDILNSSRPPDNQYRTEL